MKRLLVLSFAVVVLGAGLYALLSKILTPRPIAVATVRRGPVITTIVVATHDPRMAARTERVIYLVDGRVRDDGPSPEVLERVGAQTKSR